MKLQLFGSSVALEVVDDEVIARIGWLFADLARGVRPAGRKLRLLGTGDDLTLLDGEAVVRSRMGPNQAVAMLLWEINQVGVTSSSHAVLHAGCVAWKGRGLVLAGGSGAGKSTLVAALIQRGFSYLSDELAGYSPADCSGPTRSPLDSIPGPAPCLLRSRPARTRMGTDGPYGPLSWAAPLALAARWPRGW